MPWWSRFFPPTSLAAIDRPTRARLVGHVSSDNDAVGRMSGLRGALIELQFSARYHKVRRDRYGRQVETDEEAYEILSTWMSEPPLRVTCADGELIVPTAGMSVRFAGDGHGVPIDRPVPADVAEVLGSPKARGRMVFYRELALSRGDKVRVDATVAPADQIDVDHYRGTTTRRWIARVDLAPIVVHDLSLDEV